jgi:lysine 2,3-aminomutase
MLATERLDYILSSIARIKSIETIRIGTRALVVLPQRIDESLCKVLKKYENLWVNTQFNHPLEVTPYAIEACRKLQSCGIPISNQSVLLKGINDDTNLMISLCQKLQSIRVRPYYLYECDPVIGASHFRTSIWKGIEIIERMRGYTSGMCIPNFVVDGPEGKGKIPIGPNYLLSISPEGVTLRNYNNETFFYYNPKD